MMHAFTLMYVYPMAGLLYRQTWCCLQNVSQVIGIEMCKEAVEDANVNAGLNGEQVQLCKTNLRLLLIRLCMKQQVLDSFTRQSEYRSKCDLQTASDTVLS